MSRTTHSRRPLQRLGLIGVGSAVLLVGIAPAAAAAEDVVIPLDPIDVLLATIPVESVGVAGLMADPMGDPTAGEPTPVPVQYGDQLTVQLPAELATGTSLQVELAVDENGDDAADTTYSTTSSTHPLTVTGQGTTTIVVTLPATGVDGAVADLTLAPVTTTLGATSGADFTFLDPVGYALRLGTAALDPVILAPGLLALSTEPCSLQSPCPFPEPLTAGSTVTLSLPADSSLRELGIADLSDVQVALQAIDAAGEPTGEPVVLTVQVVAPSTATVTLPADLAAGSYGLVVAQPTDSGASVVALEVTVEAAAVAAPTTPAAPATAAPVNAGLRSNTGVEAVESGSTGDVAVAAGAGMLLLAGAGGVVVARNRRRAAAEGGTCGA